MIWHYFTQRRPCKSPEFCPGADPSLQTQVPRLQFCPKAGLPSQTQEPRQLFYWGLNRCGSFPLLFAPHSLFSIWTDLKRSQKIPGAPAWRRGEWIWLTGPSGLHQNSPQGSNISSIMVFDQIRDPEIPITLRPQFFLYKWKYYVRFANIIVNIRINRIYKFSTTDRN